MSCLQNDKAIDKLQEEFDDAFVNDYELRGALAYKLLDSLEYYQFCKDDMQEFLDDLGDEIYEKIEACFFHSLTGCTDIRVLAERAFNITID